MQTAPPNSSLPHRTGHNVCVSSLGYGLDDREVAVRFPAGTEMSQSIQTGSEAHSTYYPNKIGGARPLTETAKAT
jgi:hypothetical protein